MDNEFKLEELNNHPFAIYVREALAARDKVVDEITRLRLVIGDGSLREEDRQQASKDIADLVSALGLMDEAHRTFIARVVLGPFPPRVQVVERTVELNKNLAQDVADANRAQAIIRLIAIWSSALSSVVTGQVAAMLPAAVPAAPADDAVSP